MSRRNAFPRKGSPESVRRSLKLTAAQRIRAERDWAEMVERVKVQPGAWGNTLAYLAGENTNRSAIEVLRAWGIAPAVEVEVAA